MEASIAERIHEAIRVEQNMAEVYQIIELAFPQDAAFWAQLCQEERGHVALLQSSEDYFDAQGDVIRDMASLPLEALRARNVDLRDLIARYRTAAPPRAEAFEVAVRLEEALGEAELQQLASNGSQTPEYDVFRQLLNSCRDHALRIRTYMAGDLGDG